jgi:hypothetical protein
LSYSVIPVAGGFYKTIGEKLRDLAEVLKGKDGEERG